MSPQTHYANEAKEMMDEAKGLFQDAEAQINQREYEKANITLKLASVKYNAGLKTLKFATSLKY